MRRGSWFRVARDQKIGRKAVTQVHGIMDYNNENQGHFMHRGLSKAYHRHVLLTSG
jgi:hypothetical protein